ncbi:unnamed protein product [Prunus armeniaca]|uniref:Uncharacterized protein n=1 Tax=Prunus armeniaca TaxID=36596 RepID=A0A6J5X7L7_PRUAR|nr:unnamed protein product [Prunus armeniaca]
MTTVVHISINSLAFRLSSLHNDIYKKPIKYYSVSRTKIGCLKQNRFKVRAYWERWSSLGGGSVKDEMLGRDEGWKKKKKREVVVRFNQGFGFNGDGGGGGKDDGATARVLVLVPIVGVGAFLWWARQDMVQDSCPNCGNDFQIFKSALNDDLQQCPFCTQPFSVVDNKFVMDSVKYSNQSTTFGQAFNDYTRSTRGKESSKAVVDIEAEVKDAD